MTKQKNEGDMPRRERLWIVSELYYPEQTSTGYFLTQIAEGLADEFDVQILCGQPSYSEHGMKAPSLEERRGTTIHRLHSTHFGKDRLALRAINVVTFMIAVFIVGVLRFRRGDRVMVVSNPPLSPLAAGAPSLLRGCRTYLLVHDVYPEVMGATGTLPTTGAIYRLLLWLFAATFRMYQQIVVLGRDMAEVIRAKIRPAERDIFLIPNWADVDMVNPLERAENPFALEQGLIDKFVVQFSGNIGRTHNIELLLETARLLEHRDDVVFLFVGYGGKTGLIDNAKRSGSKNIMFAPRQPRERLGPMLATSDLTVISFVPGMRGLSVPSRMYNVMAAGAAVLAVADPASELALTVQEAGAGWVMPEANPTALAALLEKLAADPSRRETRARGACGRHAVTTSFTLPIVLDQYRRLFRG